MIKPRLVIISDLHGLENSSWLDGYKLRLEKEYDIHYYDSRVLAQINPTEKNQAEIHAEFIHGGIDKAVQHFLKLEQNNCAILGFSVGGTIAWKIAMKTELVKQLFCISSTRLRYETVRPTCNIKGSFGALDPYRPSKEWLNVHKINCYHAKDRSHEFYKEKGSVNWLCDFILK